MMKEITSESLILQGYQLLNGCITSADLSMSDHGCLTLNMVIEGDGWGVTYGGICIGHGYLGAETFEGSPKGIEYLMQIMNTVGVDMFSKLTGKYVRCASKGWGSSIKIIGNILKDQWFDPEVFFSDNASE